ncbi:MAG TPA: polyprenol monophosphomannose synthase [Vicinamibacterales bacterium]|nr:polyprenol monophosphomannose synthase [Vicinamibacterales bacterium]
MQVLIVVPTYNERENLPTLVRALLQEPDYRVLVVDDDSPDGTGAIAEALVGEFGARVRCLHRRGPRGLGRAYVDGFSEAVATDADLVCQMDADLSHDVGDLREMLAAAADGTDLVIGSRYVRRRDTPGWPMRRRLLSQCANAYARAWSGLTERDCTSGFRCWRREALAEIDLTGIVSRGYAFQIEMLVAAARRRFRVVEVPIVFRERATGASKMSAAIIAESALMPWRMRSGAQTEARRASSVPDGGAA